MPKNSAACGVDRKSVSNDFRQFLGYVRVHPLALRPRRFGGVDIKAGTQAEIVAVGLARNAEPTGAGIRHDDRKSELCSNALRARLHDEILFRAGETRKPIKYGNAASVALRRN